MTHIHFTDEDWERVERDWTAWWDGELDRPLVLLDGTDAPGQLNFALDTVKKHLKLKDFTLWDLIKQPLPAIFSLNEPAEKVMDAFDRLLSTVCPFGDNYPRYWLNFGPGIVAGFLGSRVNAEPNTVWFDMPTPVDLDTWQPYFDPDNPWWERVQALTRMSVERWGNRVVLCHTDLGGNLDILASFRSTQQLLLDCAEQPQQVERLCAQITRVWLRYYNEQLSLIKENGRGTSPWAHIWSPFGRTYMLQSDFSYMISPSMFERFVLPDLNEICNTLDHGFYHLDGKGAIKHLDMLLSIKRLRGIQWIPGDGAPPPEEWLELLRRIRAGGKLVQVYVTAEGARRIVRELGGKGFALYITTPMSRGKAEALYKLILEEDNKVRV